MRVRHFQRERDPKLAMLKREEVLKKTGKLACEACGFVAARTYPDLGAPLVEVHHCVPLSASLQSAVVTTADLAVLCPTCHRAIHRADCMAVAGFRERYFS